MFLNSTRRYICHLRRSPTFKFILFERALEDASISDSEREMMVSKLRNIGSHQTRYFGEYVRLFDGAEMHDYRGEASHYSNCPKVAYILKEFGIRPKILVCVRNPVQMAWCG